ncbi:MAG TPA: hypothetical protein VFJ76_02505 [Solirubrobacterales bacterium]|nr:hypothetical protein [Solirubrobacterales bacterium]
MTRNKGRRARLGMTWFALALGALALLAMPGLAAAKDRNHDHIPDKWEKKHHLSLKTNQAHKNQDGDRLRNRAEFLAGDNPRDADSNDDGVMDGEDNAGTIVSFDSGTGRLTIDLFGGEAISGLVDEGTEIKCEDNSGASASSEGTGPGEEAGDDDGGEEVEPGDDGGGQEEVGDDDGQGEEEPGDDNGGEEVGDDDGGGSGDNSGPGSENSGPGNGDDADGGSTCTTADLVPGAVVQEAELKVANGQATFEEVELSGKEA